MKIFGKNEAELKQIASELDKKNSDLDNRELTLKSAESSLENEKNLLKNERTTFESRNKTILEKITADRNNIASSQAELEKRRIELSKLEAEANAGFVDMQREAFKETIEKRIAGLDARQQELDEQEKQFSNRLKDLHDTEGKLAERELAVTELEQKANAGFADKAKALADEASRQHQENQAEADRLQKRSNAITEERNDLEEAKAKLVQRKEAIIASEQKRDAGFADERATLDIELRDKRANIEAEIADAREQKLSALEDEIAKLKTNRLEEITRTEQAERDRIRGEIAKEREAWTNQQEETHIILETKQTQLEKQKGDLSAMQSELEGRETELAANEKALVRKEERLELQWQNRNDKLDDTIEERVEEERETMNSRNQSLIKANADLRESIRIQTELVGAFDQLKRQLGDSDPADIIRQLNSKTDEIARLNEELATRPTEEMRERYDALDLEAKNQKARADQLEKQISENAAAISEVAELRRNNSELNAANKSLSQQKSIFEGAANEAEAELNRLRAAYERPAEVEARYKEIEMPHIKADVAKQPAKSDIDENTWLAGVANACSNYGFHFNPRILKAFHTGLKTAEWSPLTVLAGVSGTGKSELPRLYSHFGGLMFEPLSVQPNWDSQESMLGFFNSIDNKFDAQPLLRFLAQSQKSWVDKTDDSEGYPGLQDGVCLALLDEMNLAHPELYFAEFLSKLELRRGKKGSDVPFLPVKIGAGMPPYQLPLGRNVLWTGTMNQDETTKSLSDKVLDRSIIIHFPRPTELKRRRKLTALDEKNRGSLLHKCSWHNWLELGSSFSDDDVKPFKKFIEEINTSLAVAGRAIGHRIWQSVEYYMANYPDVRVAREANDKDELAKALHIAFEDQLVQKVMPKLRGIDTRGRSRTDCLDKILGQINTGLGGNAFNLAEDFNLACDLGYGQFIWQSANYISDTDPAIDELSAETETQTEDGDSSPPENTSSNIPDIADNQASAEDLSKPPRKFSPNSSNRDEMWNNLSDKQKRMFLKH